ncbi:MAG: hypothetical protein ACJ73J_00140 [Actinomycetes bacterium]
MTAIELTSDAERRALVQYLERTVALDNRAVVRLQARGSTLGVWSGPPFEVVALRAASLAFDADLDVTVSAQRLSQQLTSSGPLELPPQLSGPTWVGLLPPRVGWEERLRGDVAGVRAAVGSAKQFFRERAAGVDERAELERIAQDVWERPCLAEVPVRCGHAAESLGLMGPGDGVAVAYATDTWVRLAVPGGSVSTRRGYLPSIAVMPLL